MPKFVIERQYLVPMNQHIVVETESLGEACKKAVSDDIDWDTQEMDSDSARATTITEAKMVPEGPDCRGKGGREAPPQPSRRTTRLASDTQ